MKIVQKSDLVLRVLRSWFRVKSDEIRVTGHELFITKYLFYLFVDVDPYKRDTDTGRL